LNGVNISECVSLTRIRAAWRSIGGITIPVEAEEKPMTPWNGERIVELTLSTGRTYRVTLRGKGKPTVQRVIFGTVDNEVNNIERSAAIYAAKRRGAEG
jgi:hypothetical protein